MKRLVYLILCISMLIYLCSCGIANTSELTSPKATTLSYENNEAKNNSDRIVDSFLKALQNKDEENIKKLSLFSNPDCYTSLYNNIEITDYAFSVETTKYNNYLWGFYECPAFYYNVTLTTTDTSMSPSTFNKSEWVLATNSNGVVLFTSADEFVDQNNFNSHNLSLSLVYHYQLFKDMYPADFNHSSQSSVDYICSLAGTIYGLSNNVNDKPIDVQTLNTFVRDTFKVKDFDASKCSFYDKSTDSITNYSANVFLPSRQVNSIDKNASGDYSISVTYYLDNLMMIKSKTVIYTVSYLADYQYSITDAITINEE